MARRTRTVGVTTPLLDEDTSAPSSYTQDRVNARRYSGFLSDADYLRRQRYSRRNRSAGSDPIPMFQGSEDLPLESQLDIYYSIVQQQDMVENIRAQSWPMQVKLRSIRYICNQLVRRSRSVCICGCVGNWRIQSTKRSNT
jgi:hypothetical protein